MFGSADVKTEVRTYFNAIQAILPGISSEMASRPADDPMRVASLAFQQQVVVAARAAVLTAMSQDLGEKLADGTAGR
jgi:hypothetical protein